MSKDWSQWYPSVLEHRSKVMFAVSFISPPAVEEPGLVNILYEYEKPPLPNSLFVPELSPSDDRHLQDMRAARRERWKRQFLDCQYLFHSPAPLAFMTTTTQGKSF